MREKPKPTIDRRVARSRATLQHALLGLMLEKGYDAITVEEICDAANVGRSTFYAHFTSKEDLKRSGLEIHLRTMLGDQRKALKKGEEVPFAFVLPFLEHARDHIDLYRALVTKGGAPTTIKILREIVTDEVRREVGGLAKANSAEVLPREAATQFVVGAFMSLLSWWLDGGAKLPPQRLDAIFKHLAIAGMRNGAD